MNLIQAVVRSAAGREAIVEVESTGCGRCHEPGGCGGASKADLFCRNRTYRVLNPVGAGVGEQVNVAIADGAISDSATRAYLVPVAFMLLGALIGRAVADPSLGEASVICGAVLGLGTGWWSLRFVRRPMGSEARPTIVSRV